ncbi:two-component regulator propeller domain-containing protein [Spirosoma areae]
MKNHLSFVCLALLWLLSGFSQSLAAQSFNPQPTNPIGVSTQSPTRWFQHLTLRKGLAANFSTSISQDSLGFIWIGTVNGLTRFDGLNCRTFVRQAGDPHSLSHRITRSVFTARNGTLWVGAQQGLNRYDQTTQAFQRYSFAALGADCNFIRVIAESPDGNLWCGTKGGVVRFDPVSAKAQLVPIPTDEASRDGAKGIRALLVDGTQIWIGTQAGLYAYAWRTKQFRPFRQNRLLASSLPDDYVTALARHPHTGDLVVGTHGGHVARLNPSTGTFRPLPLAAENQPVSSLLFTKNGDFWVGMSNAGLHHYDPAKNRFTAYLNDELNPRSIGSNSVKALFEDRSGIIWVITDDAGVSWSNPVVEKFHSVFDDVAYRPASTLGLDAAKLSIDRKNHLWAATRDGLVRIDPRTQSYRLFRHDPKNPNSLGANFLYSVLADRRSLVWAGGPAGLTRFDPARGQFERIPTVAASENSAMPKNELGKQHNVVVGEQVFTMIEHRDGRIFIGTNEKLTIYDPRTGAFSHQFTDERIRKLPGKNYNTLYFDRYDNLWVGGLGPVYKISPDLQLLAAYIHREEDATTLPSEGATGFAEDASGHIWISTDDGLARLDERTGRFKTFTTRDGLPTNDMAALLAVGDTLWVSTSRGIACVNTRRLRLTNFDEADGLPTAEFESNSAVRDASGRIYFGAMRGLVYVQPNRIQMNRFVPPVFLTSFRVNDQEFLRGPLTNPPPVVLNYTQNGFTFDMAALSFDNPAGNQYAYRLEGFEDRWNQAGNRPFASYTNVPPDDYVLHVIGANNDGIWNRKGYRLRVVIEPPFWQTWWFRIAALILVVASTVGVARWRERRLVLEQQEKSELRERIAASEMKALRSQMNPHFLYNSLNAIRLFVLQNDSDNADKYLVKFSRLMRLILENSRQEWVTLASELEQLQLYLELEQLRFDNKFDFSVDADAAIQKENVSIPPMIIQPYIENSILHGMAHKKSRGRIEVCIRPLADGLECLVEDDGVGRLKAGELKSKTISSHKSVGLKVTEERLQLISQRSGKETRVTVIDKVDEANQPAGTKVMIQLPLMPH